MTSYNIITDAETDPSAPLTSELAKKWRDNPIALAEGATGAPRVQFAALDTWFSTAGAVGTYAFLMHFVNTSTDYDIGSTLPGSVLFPASMSTDQSSSAAVTGSRTSTVLSGTWRVMGYIDNAINTKRGATLFLRIA